MMSPKQEERWQKMPHCLQHLLDVSVGLTQDPHNSTYQELSSDG